MAAAGSRQPHCMEDITECPICAETFTNPRVLPCIHTFCLECLQTYGKNKLPGDEVSCPMCRTNFVVPQKGLDGLPNNYFVNKLLLINKMSVSGKESKIQHCNPCLEENEEAEATSFCLECNEHLCETCCKSHKRLKILKNHKVVGINDKPSSRNSEIIGQLTWCD